MGQLLRWAASDAHYDIYRFSRELIMHKFLSVFIYPAQRARSDPGPLFS